MECIDKIYVVQQQPDYDRQEFLCSNFWPQGYHSSNSRHKLHPDLHIMPRDLCWKDGYSRVHRASLMPLRNLPQHNLHPRETLCGTHHSPISTSCHKCQNLNHGCYGLIRIHNTSLQGVPTKNLYGRTISIGARARLME